jgi:hypothetical protein
VLADGRCLFRAIAHGACLKNGEEAPNENRQRELADELRAKVRSFFAKKEGILSQKLFFFNDFYNPVMMFYLGC